MAKTIVLGLGNVLYGDEGFGVRLAERLDRHYVFTPELDIVDGGTRGFALLPYIEQAEQMLVLDAVDMALPAGKLVILEGEAIPRWLAARKISLHQTSFAELLALAAFRGALPRNLIILGVQPVDLTCGAPLSSLMECQLPDCEKQCLAILHRFGHTAHTAKPHAPLHAPCLLPQSRQPALPFGSALSPVTTPLLPACPSFLAGDDARSGGAYEQAGLQYPQAGK